MKCIVDPQLICFFIPGALFLPYLYPSCSLYQSEIFDLTTMYIQSLQSSEEQSVKKRATKKSKTKREHSSRYYRESSLSSSSFSSDEESGSSSSSASESSSSLHSGFVKRSRRKRKDINYKFDDFDSIIKDAVKDDVGSKWEDEELNRLEGIALFEKKIIEYQIIHSFFFYPFFHHFFLSFFMYKFSIHRCFFAKIGSQKKVNT